MLTSVCLGAAGAGADPCGRGTSAGAGVGKALSLMNFKTSAFVRFPLGPDLSTELGLILYCVSRRAVAGPVCGGWINSVPAGGPPEAIDGVGAAAGSEAAGLAGASPAEAGAGIATSFQS